MMRAGWSNLPVDIWSKIALHDGRTAARARAVCREWRRGIGKQPALMKMIAIHYIRLDDIRDLEDEIFRHYPQQHQK